MANDINDTVTKLKERLLCGIAPEGLDPSIAALAEQVAVLLAAMQKKGPAALAGLSMTDASKALMNLVKGLNELARLRAFASGGPDSRTEAPTFILKVVQPEDKSEGVPPA